MTTIMIPNDEEIEARAIAAAENEAEEWRLAFVDCTPEQTADWLDKVCGAFVTVEDLALEKGQRAYDDTLHTLQRARDSGHSDASTLLNVLSYVTEQPLHYAVIALLTTEKAKENDARANILEVLDALADSYDAKRVIGATEAFRMRAAINNREEETND